MRSLIRTMVVCLMVSLTTVLLAVMLCILGGIFWSWPAFVDYLQQNLGAVPLKVSSNFIQPLMSWLTDYVAIDTFLEITLLLLGLLAQRSFEFLYGLMVLLVLSVSIIAEGLLAWYKRGLNGRPERGLIFSMVKRDLSLPLILSFMAVILNPTGTSPVFILSVGFSWFLAKLYVAIRFYKKTL